MAQPNVPPVNVVVDREQSKIPLFHADPAHDSFQAEYWIDRLQRLRVANQWTEAQTLCHAINALRGDALHLLQYLKNNFAGQNADTTNWNLFREQFLLAFGKHGRDTSSIANLAILQKPTEPVQKFAHRVAVTTNEFFDAVNIPLNPNWNAVAHDPAWAAVVLDETVQAVVVFYINNTVQTIRTALDKTIFLNGLHAHINALVKNAGPDTMTSAVETAVKYERNRKGPIDHTIALEKSSARMSAQAINALRRGGFRGRGRSSSSFRQEPAHTNGFQPPDTKPKKQMDCWYCRKPGHVQKLCRKRIARGAAQVPKPRSVAEITADNIGYQDGTDDEEPDEDDNDYDEYLCDTLNDPPEVDVATVHIDALN